MTAAASSRSRRAICARRARRAARSSTSGGATGAVTAPAIDSRYTMLHLLAERPMYHRLYARSHFMARNDPTDTGGLFIGRRPGTAPVHYAATPDPGTGRRQRADRLLAVFVLVVETLVCLTLWGPQPLAWLWVGSQVDYHTGSVSV